MGQEGGGAKGHNRKNLGTFVAATVLGQAVAGQNSYECYSVTSWLPFVMLSAAKHLVRFIANALG